MRFHELPKPIRELAQKNYRLWAENASHPSLHFKRILQPNWSVRVGKDYRAVGKFADENIRLGVDRNACGIRPALLKDRRRNVDC